MLTINRILVPTDFSDASDAALIYGRELATRFRATLHVLHVVSDFTLAIYGVEGYMASAPDLQAEMEEGARRHLHNLVADTDGSGPPTVPVMRTSGSPAVTIVDYAKEHDIDVIVMGTHGRGALSHLFMGSVAERVVRLAPCPVLTVRHPERDFVTPNALAAVARVPSEPATANFA
jgi:nucleotide-binding universal stress UspA family protein